MNTAVATMQEGRELTLFVCGDVMTGRGIDQILPHPGLPHLFEPYAGSATDYVKLAESASGKIARPVDYAYIWGDALAQWSRLAPHARIVNLETAVTASEDAWPGKGIHYRMHPANVPCLTAAKLDCCVLANNHVMDWGRRGLLETLDVLHEAGLRTAGAGMSRMEAGAPACIDVAGTGRILVFAFAMESSGTPAEWAATEEAGGVAFLSDLSSATTASIARQVSAWKRAGDIVVVSLHWGSNWGYGVAKDEQAFARRLVDDAGADLVHGHSSHHVKGIEIYRERLILYGCGDFLNDYEGISGYEMYRADLALMYFPAFDPASGRLVRLTLVPTRTRRFRVSLAEEEGVQWLHNVLNREGRKFGTRVERDGTCLRVLPG